MKSGDRVTMNHPDGFATIEGAGGVFLGWIPNGIGGVVYLRSGSDRVVVHFDGKMLATVPADWLRLERAVAA